MAKHYAQLGTSKEVNLKGGGGRTNVTKDSRAGSSSFADFVSIAYELAMLAMPQVKHES